jgi:biotin-dependent carboxylase-like uncharacterized protein
MLEIIDPGLNSTVQDLGRRGTIGLGIPPSGAQDAFALRSANLLVGNPTGGPLVIRQDPGSAGLEILLGRLRLRALADLVVALTGAEVELAIDDAPVPAWQAIALRRGETLSSGMARRGARLYLAVHGGIDVPRYLGSRATHARGGFGGLDGRVLRAGDRLAIGPASQDPADLIGRRLAPALRPRYQGRFEVRVVPGPEEDIFTPESVRTFYGAEWKLNPKSDRTGMRFIGPALSFRPGRPRYLIEDAGEDPSNIAIDPGAPVGTIQVPSGVEPIVLGVDSPTIGGYARIGTVISTDLSVLGQARPFEVVRFVRVDHAAAVAALRAADALIAESSVARA